MSDLSNLLTQRYGPDVPDVPLQAFEADPVLPTLLAHKSVRRYKPDALPPGTLRVRRRWDDAAWPRATRGYFQMKAAIPAILQASGANVPA